MCQKPAHFYLPKWLVWAVSFNYLCYMGCITLVVLQIVFLFIKKFSWKFYSSIGVLNLIKSYVFFRLAFFCPRREGRWNILYFYYGPSLYYVSIFIEFFRPTHYVSINTVLNASKYFRTQLTQSFCWRNVGMIPYYYSWSLKLETKELHFPTVYSSTHMAKVSEKIEYWGFVYWLSWTLRINDHLRMVHFSSR